MRVVIMGCGRVGSRLAGELEAEGHEVAVIDYDAAAFRELPGGFQGLRIVGNGVDKGVQAEAGVPDADIFMALANGDNRNAMAAQVALHLHRVPRAVARIFDPERAELSRELGVRTVNPTVIVTDLAREAAFGH